MGRCQEIISEEILKAFQERGERAVANIRSRAEVDSWYDHTGNLRSSIGYALFEEGRKVVLSAFESIKGGSLGSSVGKREIDKLASAYRDSYALVVVAGMDYASKVEAIEGKDVLASEEIRVKKMVESDMKKAIAKATVRINQLKI